MRWEILLIWLCLWKHVRFTVSSSDIIKVIHSDRNLTNATLHQHVCERLPNASNWSLMVFTIYFFWRICLFCSVLCQFVFFYSVNFVAWQLNDLPLIPVDCESESENYSLPNDLSRSLWCGTAVRENINRNLRIKLLYLQIILQLDFGEPDYTFLFILIGTRWVAILFAAFHEKNTFCNFRMHQNLDVCIWNEVYDLYCSTQTEEKQKTIILFLDTKWMVHTAIDLTGLLTSIGYGTSFLCMSIQFIRLNELKFSTKTARYSCCSAAELRMTANHACVEGYQRENNSGNEERCEDSIRRTDMYLGYLFTVISI